MSPSAALQRLRQEIGLEPVRLFRTCRADDPMPTDADRHGWRHPDWTILTITEPYPPGVPMILAECPHCGFAWTIARY